MLKIAVFDSGFGGELFADQLEETVPVVKVIRVIDWRHADELIKNPRSARIAAETALRPYIGTVDLIIFANHLLSLTSLKYFRRQYPHQLFLGLDLPRPRAVPLRPTLVLTTTAVAHSLAFRRFVFTFHRNATVFLLDTWPNLIDDGELTDMVVRRTLNQRFPARSLVPVEIVLACSHFNDLKPALRHTYSANVKISDGFTSTITAACRLLDLRGSITKKK